jgi:hypothetical protein
VFTLLDCRSKLRRPVEQSALKLDALDKCHQQRSVIPEYVRSHGSVKDVICAFCADYNIGAQEDESCLDDEMDEN